MLFKTIYDENLAAAAYLIGCQKSGESILIDPQRDIDRYISIAKKEGLRITAVTETHIHADYLSGVREVAEQTGATVYLSAEGGDDWSYEWLDKKCDGGSYTHTLLHDGTVFSVGNIEFKAIHTPGHTPEHIAFLVTDKGSGATEPIGIASGDFLFVGDLGRPDLLETAAGMAGAADSAARTLYSSLQKLKSLPEFVQVWPAHGAGSACGKALGAIPVSTIGYENRFNPAIKSATQVESFLHYILDGQPEPPLYFARMKRENKVGPKLLGSLPEPKTISAQELKNIDTKRDVLIDTRNWAQFRFEHVPGSFFHPLNKSFVTDIGSMVGDNPNIYLICTVAERQEIVRNLIRVGLDNVIGWAEPTILNEYARIGGKLVETKEEDVSEIKKKIDSKAVNVLDVRKLSEHNEGHIQDAQNIVHTRLASKLGDVPSDKKLVVHCRSGVRSSYACALLERAGFDIINMAGGMLAWEKNA